MQLKTTITIRVDAKDIQAAAAWDSAIKTIKGDIQGNLPMGVTVGSVEITTAQARSKVIPGAAAVA